MLKRDKKRWYDDACGTAFALELIGERWVILIMRELMFGPRRFGELRRDLPGISANILTQRLDRLEQNQIVRRRVLPSPASVQIYELTPWGLEAERVIQMLGKWATRHPDHDPTLPLSGASLLMSFCTMLDKGRAAEIDIRAGFDFGTDQYVAHVHAGTIAVSRESAEEVDLQFAGPPTAVAAAIYGGDPFADFVGAEMLAIAGDRNLVERFAALFMLPEKLSAQN